MAGGPRAARRFVEFDSMGNFFEKVRVFFRNIIEFIKDTKKELKNVSWPNRHELVSTTVVVIVCVFFFGTFLWLVDIAVSKAMVFMLAQLSS
jgi:preprotein translocase subunit SecE